MSSDQSLSTQTSARELADAAKDAAQNMMSTEEGKTLDERKHLAKVIEALGQNVTSDNINQELVLPMVIKGGDGPKEEVLELLNLLAGEKEDVVTIGDASGDAVNFVIPAGKLFIIMDNSGIADELDGSNSQSRRRNTIINATMIGGSLVVGALVDFAFAEPGASTHMGSMVGGAIGIAGAVCKTGIQFLTTPVKVIESSIVKISSLNEKIAEAEAWKERFDNTFKVAGALAAVALVSTIRTKTAGLFVAVITGSTAAIAKQGSYGREEAIERYQHKLNMLEGRSSDPGWEI